MSSLVDRPTQLICIWISICHNEKKTMQLNAMSSSTALKKPGAHLNKSLWEKCDHHLLQRDFTATVPFGKLKSSFRKELERWRSKFHFSSDFTFEVLFSSVRTFYLEPHLAKRLGAARLLVDHQCLGNFLIRWPPNLFFPSLLRQASSFPAHFLFHFNWLLLSISNFIILSLNFYLHVLKFSWSSFLLHCPDSRL